MIGRRPGVDSPAGAIHSRRHGRPILARSRAKVYSRQDWHLFLQIHRYRWREKVRVATTMTRPMLSRGGRGVKILVVDDEPDALEIVSRTFLRAGYEVLTTASGEKALDLIPSARPDLVV